MIAVNCTAEQLQQALGIINVNYLGNIALTDLEQTAEGIQFSLSVKDSKGPGVLLDHKGRSTTSACWHAVGHFIDELFVVDEEAEIYSDWNGTWITRTGGNWQDWNLGTKERPPMLSRSCDCNKRLQAAADNLIPAPMIFRPLTKEQFRKCPLSITDPSHFWPDGTCDCVHEVHQKKEVKS
jgi:hypothetical protein